MKRRCRRDDDDGGGVEEEGIEDEVVVVPAASAPADPRVCRPSRKRKEAMQAEEDTRNVKKVKSSLPTMPENTAGPEILIMTPEIFRQQVNNGTRVIGTGPLVLGRLTRMRLSLRLLMSTALTLVASRPR